MENLRSGYEEVGGIVFFGRMLDKIRLNAKGRLPSDYNLGNGLDGRVCRFLGVDYERLVGRTLKGGSDNELLRWCFDHGREPTDEEVLVFNGFMRSRGWRDDVSEWVDEQKERLGLTDRDNIQTAFDIHDADEGRAPTT